MKFIQNIFLKFIMEKITLLNFSNIIINNIKKFGQIQKKLINLIKEVLNIEMMMLINKKLNQIQIVIRSFEASFKK